MKAEMIKRIAVRMLAAWVLVISLTAAAQAATLTVTSNVDSDVGIGGCADGCSLREAYNYAASGDEIRFDPAFFNIQRTITLTVGQIYIEKDLTITGPGANLLTISGNNSSRIFYNYTNTLTLSGMTLTGANPGSFQSGGAISNFAGDLTVLNCYITGNRAGFGAGIHANNNNTVTIINSTISNNTSTGAASLGGTSGGIDQVGGSRNNNLPSTLIVINSTISGNSATNDDDNGGGIQSGGNVTITNSTIADNFANGGNSAGGVFNASGTVTVRNSIISANRTIPEVKGNGFVSEGYNLVTNTGMVTAFNQSTDQIDIDPRLFVLSFNGGTTPTHRLDTNSPAIDKGKAFGSTTDQRGFIRPFDYYSISNAAGGDGSDIGAYEVSPPSITVTKIEDTNDGVCNADCSLREAIAAATADNIISFSTLFNTARTITLTGGELVINKNLNIFGTGADKLIISANNTSRVFNIESGVVRLRGMTITRGRATSVNGTGGAGIFNFGTLTVENCHVTQNNADSSGGGIFNLGETLNVTGSTFSNNTAGGGGGNASGGAGIYGSGTINITNSTISDNVVTGGTNNGGGIAVQNGTTNITSSTISDNGAAGANSAGGIRTSGGTLTIRNTIVAANRSNTTLPDVSGAFTSGGYNLIGNVGTATGFGATGDQTGILRLWRKVLH